MELRPTPRLGRVRGPPPPLARSTASYGAAAPQPWRGRTDIPRRSVAGGAVRASFVTASRGGIFDRRSHLGSTGSRGTWAGRQARVEGSQTADGAGHGDESLVPERLFQPAKCQSAENPRQ